MKSPISKFTVFGNSMFPTLKPGQDVLSVNWFYKPKVGDLVVIKQNGKEMVKRVHYIHGREVIVQGDNKGESTDSRHFGPIKREQIVGKVIYRDSHFSRESTGLSRGNDMVECSNCGTSMVGIAGRKDAICSNCGFKLTCCGEP